MGKDAQKESMPGAEHQKARESVWQQTRALLARVVATGRADVNENQPAAQPAAAADK